METQWVIAGAAGVLVALAAYRMVRMNQGGAEARMKISQGATVIDVRTAGEYAAGHFEGARNIPLQELPGRLAEVGAKDKAVVVYCASGMRSAQAAGILKAAGYADVTNAGGLDQLKAGRTR